MTPDYDYFVINHTLRIMATQIWRNWQKSAKFDGLVPPETFTMSMVAAIQAVDAGDIEVLFCALNSVKWFAMEKAIADKRVNFIFSYAKKVGFPIAICNPCTSGTGQEWRKGNPPYGRVRD